MLLHSLRLLEFAHTLDVIHEVSPVDVLHHKVEPILGEDIKHRAEKPLQVVKTVGESVKCDFYVICSFICSSRGAHTCMFGSGFKY